MKNACKKIDSLLSDHIDGNLDQIEVAEVETHLAICSTCRSEMRALKRTRELLAFYTVPKPPKNYDDLFADQLRQKLAQRSERYSIFSVIGVRLSWYFETFRDRLSFELSRGLKVLSSPIRTIPTALMLLFVLFLTVQQHQNLNPPKIGWQIALEDQSPLSREMISRDAEISPPIGKIEVLTDFASKNSDFGSSLSVWGVDQSFVFNQAEKDLAIQTTETEKIFDLPSAPINLQIDDETHSPLGVAFRSYEEKFKLRRANRSTLTRNDLSAEINNYEPIKL